ncbi:hypothetical protein Tco_0629038 [Tanacetum coccineum]|uniref:Uncharacterized protein n=1 Tax=Tanacetum coccineum TaxID=301880 RepID=A0ABQ4WS18_9ASTR
MHNFIRPLVKKSVHRCLVQEDYSQSIMPKRRTLAAVEAAEYILTVQHDEEVETLHKHDSREQTLLSMLNRKAIFLDS